METEGELHRSSSRHRLRDYPSTGSRKNKACVRIIAAKQEKDKMPFKRKVRYASAQAAT